ncbi:MAG: decaprenylphospho-beta-D-erythro-pentofuranosid-2-ulose 2-reductase [Propionibacteriaceae bacterium]|nr:decaprenylphospho-beta-D-erythro-pentofuranosid-2-ulose 2-reductase [Propionibacteriaceae bacterium]
MINATGDPQTIALLGGTSELGLAIVAEYLAQAPAHVVLGIRPASSERESAVEQMTTAGALSVRVVDLDALDTAGHPKAVDQIAGEGDIDLAIIAFGLLGDADTLWQDQARVVDFIGVNYTGAVSVGVLLANRMREQGHGQMIVCSSVAGEKVRRSNFVYGSTKAGLDGFFTQLNEAHRNTGVSITVARPGMIRTKMTVGMPDAPLTLDPDEAARIIVEAARAHKPIVWVPPLFRLVMLVLHHIPAPIMRLLPL